MLQNSFRAPRSWGCPNWKSVTLYRCLIRTLIMVPITFWRNSSSKIDKVTACSSAQCPGGGGVALWKIPIFSIHYYSNVKPNSGSSCGWVGVVAILVCKAKPLLSVGQLRHGFFIFLYHGWNKSTYSALIRYQVLWAVQARMCRDLSMHMESWSLEWCARHSQTCSKKSYVRIILEQGYLDCEVM